MPPARRAQSGRVTARRAAEYLAEYVRRYRDEYRNLTARPPNGLGFPALLTSPYLSAPEIRCYLASDGYLIADFSDEIDGHDRDMAWLNLTFQPPEEIRYGRLPKSSRSPIKLNVDGNTRVVVTEYSISLGKLVQILTLGGLIPASGQKGDFWKPSSLRYIGFRTSDGKRRRRIDFAEWAGHVEIAAWDPRSIWARVHIDVRQHLASAIAGAGVANQTVQAGAPSSAPDLRQVATTRFRELGDAIDGLADLLRDHANDPEETFQRYLTEHPILLTVYGTVEPKPRFRYPPGRTSPNGKSYVEPDFVIRYPADGRYELVELERPNIEFLTRLGEPRSAVSHATFQIAEWMYYIHNHYNLIENRFPGISSEPLKRVIVSRSTENQLSGRDLHSYIAHLREQYRDYRIITYDVLLLDARIAHTGVTGLL